LDVIVVAAQGGAVWQLTDLLGRSMGNIREDATDCFTIYPEGHAFETMAGMPCGPYHSLDAALAEIETTRGAFVVALQAKSILRQGLDLRTRIEMIGHNLKSRVSWLPSESRTFLCVNQLACEKLAGGLDAFGRQDMTEARIEFRLDLETSSSQPFRRK
jgi:hypothetical protein